MTRSRDRGAPRDRPEGLESECGRESDEVEAGGREPDGSIGASPRRSSGGEKRPDGPAKRLRNKMVRKGGRPTLWTFAAVEGVPPHNNAAERALRHGVIWRKTSYGTDSEAGSRFVERMLTVVATCRQRGRDVLGFLTACLRAPRRHPAHRRSFPEPTPTTVATAYGRGRLHLFFHLFGWIRA